MRLIKNLLAIVGLIAIVAAGVTYYEAHRFLSQLDPGALGTYVDFARKLVATKDPGSAMVWSVPVDEGLGVDEVKESMKSIAANHNFLFVGESPFYKQAEAVTGKPYRYVSFLSFCDARVGMEMADYNNAYTAFMPCRIALVQDAKSGRLSLWSLDLDMMIYGGKPLPPHLKEGALRVKNTIHEIMEGAAHGSF
jgi:uncharacterized protein (DUF302 family)